MRYNAIEIRINTSAISEADLEKLKKNFDVQYYAAIDEMVLWVHDDGYKPFNRDLFQYLGALKSVYNRKAAAKGYEYTDYLDLYEEVATEEQIGEAGEEREKDEITKYYRNLRPADLFDIDLETIYLKREL
jgi:hypothetical protein